MVRGDNYKFLSSIESAKQHRAFIIIALFLLTETMGELCLMARYFAKFAGIAFTTRMTTDNRLCGIMCNNVAEAILPYKN